MDIFILTDKIANISRLLECFLIWVHPKKRSFFSMPYLANQFLSTYSGQLLSDSMENSPVPMYSYGGVRKRFVYRCFSPLQEALNNIYLFSVFDLLLARVEFLRKNHVVNQPISHLQHTCAHQGDVLAYHAHAPDRSCRQQVIY